MPRAKKTTPYVQPKPYVFRISGKPELKAKFDKEAKKHGATAVIIKKKKKSLMK